RLYLHFLKPQLCLLGGLAGALSLADDNANDQPGCRQSQHDHLKFGKRCRIMSGTMQQQDEAKLSCGESDAATIDTVAERRSDDGEKEQRQKLVVVADVDAQAQP